MPYTVKLQWLEHLMDHGDGPVGTRRLYNVISTSMQRHDVASTLRRRCIDVMCPLGGSLSHLELIIAPDKEANGVNLGMFFQSSV